MNFAQRLWDISIVIEGLHRKSMSEFVCIEWELLGARDLSPGESERIKRQTEVCRTPKVSIDTAFSETESSRARARCRTSTPYSARCPSQNRSAARCHSGADRDTIRTLLSAARAPRFVVRETQPKWRARRRQSLRHSLPAPAHQRPAHILRVQDRASCKKP